MTHHIIYIPGIGDHRPLGQDKGIGWWRVLGVKPHYRPVGWRGQEPFTHKQQRLLEEIDRYLAAGDQVSLLGFSAGASVVLNLFAHRREQITGIVLISGWLRGPESTGDSYLRRHSAFGESLATMSSHLPKFTHKEKAKMLTLNPIVDPVVSHKNGTISGVQSWRTFAFSHVMSIFMGLTFYAVPIVLHLKALSIKNKSKG